MKFLICLSLAVLAGAAENKPPNVLFIVADDLGRELSRAIMFLPPATRVERRVLAQPQYPQPQPGAAGSRGDPAGPVLRPANLLALQGRLHDGAVSTQAGSQLFHLKSILHLIL